MRRALLSIVLLALLAVACGSSPDTPAEAEPAAAHPETSRREQADTAEAEPATCGFGDDLTPAEIVIDQIPGEDRDTSPSALIGGHPDFPDPLVDPDQIISGGPPPDGIPPIDTPRFQTAASVDWLRCSEPVLSLVVDGDARLLPQRSQVEDALVSDTPLIPPVEHRKVRIEATRHVVRRQDGHAGGVPKAVGTHHRDVRVGDLQDPGGTPWRRADRRAVPLGVTSNRMAGQERHQVLGNGDRTDAGASAPVRNAEGLVQVQV